MKYVTAVLVGLGAAVVATIAVQFVASALTGTQLIVSVAGAVSFSFSFVFIAGVRGPTGGRGRLAAVVAGIISTFAILGFAISLIEPDAFRLGAAGKVLVPLAQILGAWYAAVLVTPLTSPSATLEDLWREISTLGFLFANFGAVVVILGIFFGLFAGEWVGLWAGLGVVGIGILTALIPIAHLWLRISRAEAHLQRVADAELRERFESNRAP